MSNIELIAVSIPEALRISSMGRSSLYEALKRGDIEARKNGRRTLILVQSLQDYLDDLPRYEPQATDASGTGPKAA